nr:replication initiator protein A [Salipiger aestuarii]
MIDFRLRKSLERRIYELARKYCGRQREWRVSLGVLQKKCGSGSTLREFRRLVAAIADADADEKFGHMPDYEIRIDDEKDYLVARSRGTVGPQYAQELRIPALDPDVYDMARAGYWTEPRTLRQRPKGSTPGQGI